MVGQRQGLRTRPRDVGRRMGKHGGRRAAGNEACSKNTYRRPDHRRPPQIKGPAPPAFVITRDQFFLLGSSAGLTYEMLKGPMPCS